MSQIYLARFHISAVRVPSGRVPFMSVKKSLGVEVGVIKRGGGFARWRLRTVGKFTATSRVVKGKIDKTDTRRADCGLGTAIQAHCSDHAAATLMALTASPCSERGDGPPLWAGGRSPLAPSCLSGHMIIRWNVSHIKTCMCIQMGSCEPGEAANVFRPRPPPVLGPHWYGSPWTPACSTTSYTATICCVIHFYTL